MVKSLASALVGKCGVLWKHEERLITETWKSKEDFLKAATSELMSLKVRTGN